MKRRNTFFLIGFLLSVVCSQYAAPTVQEEQLSLKELIKQAADGAVIDLQNESYTVDYLPVTGNKKITLKNGTIKKTDHYTMVDVLIGVTENCQLTLENMRIEGSPLSVGAPLILVWTGSTLKVGGGNYFRAASIDEDAASCIQVQSGARLEMTGGLIFSGSKAPRGEILVEEGGVFVMTGGTANWVENRGRMTVGGSARINEYCFSMPILSVSSPLTGSIRYMRTGGQPGTVVAEGTGGYTPSRSDASKFTDYTDKYGFGIKDGKIILTEKKEEKPIETEEELGGAIDELPEGTEEAPSEIIVETEIPLTKPLEIKDKYITLGGGGTLNSLNSGGLLTVNGGGLILDKITINGSWTDDETLLGAWNGTTLKILPDAVIHSKSSYLSTLYIDKYSKVEYKGSLTGHILNVGELVLGQGIVRGQISSFAPFSLSGAVKIQNGIFLGGDGLYAGKIRVTDPLSGRLDVLTGMGMLAEPGKPVVIAEGAGGYRLTSADFSKLNCVTDDCEFYFENNQVLMRVTDHTANEKVDLEGLKIRTADGAVEVGGIPAGRRYVLYTLSGIIVARGVSDGGTVRVPVGRSGVYVLQVGTESRKIRVSE